MNKRVVKRNGDELFPLGIGAMRLPTKNNSIDRESAQDFILFAIENGVNYIDTAYAYHGGESESFLGDILSLSGSDGVKYRDKVKLSTKLPSWMVRSREDMDAFLNEQLRKLQADVIDYYYVHSVDLSTILRLKDLGLYEFLEKAKTKKYTMSRIKRISLYTLFDITKQMYKDAVACPPHVYVLSLNKLRKDILTELNNSCANVLVRYSDINKVDKRLRFLIKLDWQAQGTLNLINRTQCFTKSMLLV